MFASFVVTLKPVAPAPIGHSTGASLHALLLNMVAQQDATLADRLHADAATKPFTVSPLRGWTKRVGERSIVMPEQLYSVRYTTLSDELFNALSQILLGKFMYRETVILDGAKFTVSNVAVEPDKSGGWGALACSDEIWKRGAVGSAITMRFASPTTFKQRGLNLLFPIPSNAFHSYRERWNSFTPYSIDDEFIPWVELNVAVEAHQLQTQMMWYDGFQLHGFTGWVRYRAKGNDPIKLKQLNALADFAFFCGTGQKTTQGMGQTRRIADNANWKRQERDQEVDAPVRKEGYGERG